MPWGNRRCTRIATTWTAPDCPDSTIAMEVRSHADLFYTEIQNAGHTYGIWGNLSNYPFLPPWVFDKYKKRPGSIALSSLNSYTTLSGNATISWGSSTGDSVEIWFSPDAGTSWQAVANAPNTGTFVWNSTLVPDCAFGSLKVFLKTGDGFIIGSDRSSYFAVHNTQNGPPFIRLLNEEFATGVVFAQDSLDLSYPLGGSRRVLTGRFASVQQRWWFNIRPVRLFHSGHVSRAADEADRHWFSPQQQPGGCSADRRQRENDRARAEFSLCQDHTPVAGDCRYAHCRIFSGNGDSPRGFSFGPYRASLSGEIR